MAIRTRKPVNSSSRFQSYVIPDGLTKKKPEKSLTIGLKKRGGRNALGRITVRHRGGGAARKYRIVDFKRIDRDVDGKISAIEYDPNRNVLLALVVFANGAKKYLLLPANMGVGDIMVSGENVEPKTGNCLPIKNIPIGFVLHNIEIRPGSGGKLVRSAGSSSQLIAKEGDYATLKMPSGEVRMVHVNCWATIGSLSNAEHKNIVLGKAGRSRHRGFRPTVRGMAMNPIDHPHGGGEGRSKSGSHPMTPWGKGCKGTRTRKRKNPLILRRRKR